MLYFIRLYIFLCFVILYYIFGFVFLYYFIFSFYTILYYTILYYIIFYFMLLYIYIYYIHIPNYQHLSTTFLSDGHLHFFPGPGRAAGGSCLGLRLDQNILANNGLPQWQIGRFRTAKIGVHDFSMSFGGYYGLLYFIMNQTREGLHSPP